MEHELGPRLVALRARRKMSAAELARRSGISGPYLCRIEKGVQEPRVGIMSKLLEALDMTWKDLDEK